MLRIVCSLVVLACFIACNNAADKIPGRYVYMVESASGTAWDTLDISKDTKAGSNAFTMIYKVTYFRKQADGSLGDRKYTCDTLSITYNKNEHALFVKEWLRPVPVDLEAGTLKFGESTFTKIP
jgi:hypothetical protein